MTVFLAKMDHSYWEVHVARFVLTDFMPTPLPRPVRIVLQPVKRVSYLHCAFHVLQQPICTLIITVASTPVLKDSSTTMEQGFAKTVLCLASNVTLQLVLAV